METPYRRYFGWSDSSLSRHCNLVLAVSLFRMRGGEEGYCWEISCSLEVKKDWRPLDVNEVSVGAVFWLKG